MAELVVKLEYGRRMTAESEVKEIMPLMSLQLFLLHITHIVYSCCLNRVHSV